MAANYLRLPGVIGNFAWVPGIANLNGSGTLEFIAKVALDVWPPNANQILISKWTGSAGYLFFLESTSNDLKLMWRDSGPARIAQATVTPTVTAGGWLWFLAVATEDGVDRDVFFYTSTDETNNPDEVTWTQLGAEVVVPFGGGDLVTNTAVVFVGAQSATVATMAGSIAAARVNFNGVTELDIDFTDLTTAELDAGSFTEDSSNAATVTVQGNEWTYVWPRIEPVPQRRFFLDTFIGDGTEDNPFRSEHGDGVRGIIDLRGDPTQQAGMCLVGAEGLVGTPLVDFGDILDQRLSVNRKQDLANQLGLTLDQTDFRAVIAELLLLHGREDGTRWRPLKQNRLGRHQIYLGGWIAYDAPVIQGTAIAESFNQADSSTLGPDLTWVEIDGDLKTISNEVTNVNTNNASWARADSDLSTDDHQGEIDVMVLTSDGSNQALAMVYCRQPASNDKTGYGARRIQNSTSDASATLRIEKLVTGTTTILDGPDTITHNAGETMKVDADGSTIRAFIDGVEKFSVTDTAITGNVQCGIRVFAQSTEDKSKVRLDVFAAQDLGAVTVPFDLIPKRTGTEPDAPLRIFSSRLIRSEVVVLPPVKLIALQTGTEVELPRPPETIFSQPEVIPPLTALPPSQLLHRTGTAPELVPPPVTILTQPDVVVVPVIPIPQVHRTGTALEVPPPPVTTFFRPEVIPPLTALPPEHLVLRTGTDPELPLPPVSVFTRPDFIPLPVITLPGFLITGTTLIIPPPPITRFVATVFLPIVVQPGSETGRSSGTLAADRGIDLGTQTTGQSPVSAKTGKSPSSL